MLQYLGDNIICNNLYQRYGGRYICFFARTTSWDSGVLFICHTRLYICCPSYRGRLFWLPPGLCVGKLLPDLDMLSAMLMSCCVCSWGLDLPACSGLGSFLFLFSVSSGGLLMKGHFD